MLKYLLSILFIGLAWGQETEWKVQWEETNIAVFDFENNGLSEIEIRALSDRLRSEIVQLGKIIYTVQKKILPNYGVFDEKRYFSSTQTKTKYSGLKSIRDSE